PDLGRDSLGDLPAARPRPRRRGRATAVGGVGREGAPLLGRAEAARVCRRGRRRIGPRVASRRVYAIVVFLLDGLGDRAHEVLGGRTGNEAAETPNLDRLCASGSCGLLYAVGPGRAPSSEVAHWSVLGYRPEEFP